MLLRRAINPEAMTDCVTYLLATIDLETGNAKALSQSVSSCLLVLHPLVEALTGRELETSGL
jgi:hypothetical protein